MAVASPGDLSCPPDNVGSAGGQLSTRDLKPAKNEQQQEEEDPVLPAAAHFSVSFRIFDHR